MKYRIEMESYDKNLFLQSGFDTDYEFTNVDSALDYVLKEIPNYINKEVLFIQIYNRRDLKIRLGRDQSMPVAKIDYNNGDIVTFTIWKKRK